MGVKKATQHGAFCSVFLTKFHSGDKSRRLRWTGLDGDIRGAYRVLVRKSGDRRPLG
jgi:hypothetical protein